MIIAQNTNTGQCRCIATGMESRIFAHSTATDYLHEAGCRILSDGTVTLLYLNETITALNPDTNREEVYLVLPKEELSPLIDLAQNQSISMSDSPETRIRRIYRLFSYLTEARRQGAVSKDFFRATLAAPLSLLTNAAATELIVLPPQLILRCITASPNTALPLHYSWVHPDGERADTDEAAAFFLASLSYACFTGGMPFGFEAEPFAHIQAASSTDRPKDDKNTELFSNADREQLTQNMRDAVFVPIALRCPALSPDFTDLLDRSLQIEKQVSEEIPPLFERICAYREENLPIHTEKRATNTAEVGTFIEKKRRQIKRKRFFIKQRGKIAAAAVAVLLLCSIGGAVLVRMNKPPETAGLSAQAVIQGFYTAIGTLDQAKLSAYSKNKAGAEYDNLMVHLFVTEKMREVYEQKKIYYSPEEFLLLCDAAANLSEVPENAPMMRESADEASTQFKKTVIGTLRGGSVYGISQLSITPATLMKDAQLGDTAAFEVYFYYWIPLLPAEKTEALLHDPHLDLSGFFPVQVFRYRDRIKLTEYKGSLFIGAVEPLERTLIVPSSTELLTACMMPHEDQPEYLRNGAHFYHEQ